VGGFLDRGFKIEALSAIKTLKSGVQTVTLRMATAKPEAAKTVAEIAGEMGMSVAEVLAMLKA
jgi:predicted transcriptional regulator